MALDFAIPFFPLSDLFETLLPDFVLAFAFFTALIYGVLGRRFGPGRPTVAIAGALGMALAVGLVWWEAYHGLSIRDLGPIAVGIAIIILGGVMYQAIRQSGGGWAGAGIALGVSILISSILGVALPLDARVLQPLATAGLTIGVLAFLLHRRGVLSHPFPITQDLADVHHDMDDLYDDRRAARSLGKGLRHLRKEAGTLFDHPERADDVMLQLRRMLPAEGWLTERMARLREKAHRIRVGHIMQIEELQKHIANLPTQAKRKAASELAAMYRELKFNVRLERLDRAVAENERRVRDLTQQAQVLLQRQDHNGLVAVLDAARKLQAHNARLLRTISHTEKRLLAAAQDVARKAGGVKAR